MPKALAVSTLVLGLGCAALGSGDALEEQLNLRFRGHVFALRHPLTERSQKYGAGGAPLTTSPEGSWTLYGRIKVDKIALHDGELRLAGDRLWYEFDSAKQQFAGLRSPDEGVKIAIRLDHPPASVDDAIAILGRVFCLTPEDLAASTPDLWHGYLKKMVASLQPQNPETPGAAREPSQPAHSGGRTAPGTAAGSADGQKTSHLGEPGVSAPRPLFAPEPEFTEAARKWKYAGVSGFNVVVDPKGRISRLELVHALGLGLDESAAETIRTWRFDPGKLNGQPVSVAVYIEVSFSFGTH